MKVGVRFAGRLFHAAIGLLQFTPKPLNKNNLNFWISLIETYDDYGIPSNLFPLQIEVHKKSLTLVEKQVICNKRGST